MDLVEEVGTELNNQARRAKSHWFCRAASADLHGLETFLQPSDQPIFFLKRRSTKEDKLL